MRKNSVDPQRDFIGIFKPSQGKPQRVVTRVYNYIVIRSPAGSMTFAAGVGIFSKVNVPSGNQ